MNKNLFQLIASVLTVFLVLIFENVYGVFNSIPICPKSDTSKSILLNEVKIIANKLSLIETEKPKRKKHYSFLSKAPCQIGMLFDDDLIIGKRIKNVSIYFDEKKKQNYVFQLLLFSKGKDNLPLTKLHNKELPLLVNHLGWNEFPVLLDNLVIPEGGIFVIVNFFAKSKFYSEETDRIAMGKYSGIKQFCFRSTSLNDWFVLKSFQEGKIGPMMRLQVEN
ncbi:hypothetical protein EOJ36_11260 [Sandaracinomonas limnophila]|uniref:Uncharacterized protein n=1 Tax=Sandaracinomonas limnophila TaxID=1862386 RepID=A0A437PLZ2_9BACT|nr:hypothetical protein [Sandaracinomonas limnophila]RVU23305.1 hypothetical protein EOJ36_11260 [Sandaracinomonas limnophila]